MLTFASIFVIGAPPIQELVHFLLALQAIKLLAPKKNRDWLQLYLLSFFSMVASSALTVELSFAAIFIGYLFLAPWVLMLLQLKEGSEAAGKDPTAASPPLDEALARLVEFTFDHHHEHEDFIRMVMIENIHKGNIPAITGF